MKLNLKSYLGISLTVVLLTSCSAEVNTNIINEADQISSLAKNSSVDEIANYLSKIAREDDKMKDVKAQPIEGKVTKALPKFNDKQLTYFTYEALDNNLYGDLNRVVNTLESIGSNNNINLVAQTDNWKENNTARYFITKDPNFELINSQYLKLGSDSEDSGDPNVFSTAVKWAFSTYPSKTKWLNMSTHGYGFAGIGYDDNPDNSMDIVSFSQALKKGLGNQKLDIVSFDACLMSTVEVASELKDVANILIGSEDSTFYWGYGYYKTFSKIAKNSNMKPSEISRSLVLDVNNKGSGNQTFTIAATDLTKTDILEASINDLSKSLRKALTKERDNIFRALNKSKPFTLAGEDIPFRDINRVIGLLKDNVKDTDVISACNKINDVLYRKGVIMLSRQSKDEKDQGRGLSIYVPLNGTVNKLYRETKFAKNTQWDEFLLELNNTIKQTSK